MSHKSLARGRRMPGSTEIDDWSAIDLVFSEQPLSEWHVWNSDLAQAMLEVEPRLPRRRA